MPLVTSTFRPPLYLRSASIQTITPSLFRRLPLDDSRPETLELPDGDFLELEWTASDRSELVILTHGLEGSTQSSYIKGLAHALLQAGYGVLTWNMRGCGRDRNRLPTWYHSGQSSDLRAVINHATGRTFAHIHAVGISVGGNILLKYLGEEGTAALDLISSATVVSVPMDLRGSAKELAKQKNRIYMNYLLKPLRARIREKARRFPKLFDTTRLDSIRTFQEFDTLYTAPMHGFASVDSYWDSSSSLHFLDAIRVPTLIISALDDPFLSPSCFPSEVARYSDALSLETPLWGGHVGFIDSLRLSRTWLDRRIVQNLADYSPPR